jgi:hypothetical protein
VSAGDDAERSDEEERRTIPAGDDAERSDEEERRTIPAGDDAERSDVGEGAARVMAFGERKRKDEPIVEPEVVGAQQEPETPVEDGPFDIEDFDDPAAAEAARLDLGSVLIAMPAAAQLQVELTEAGIPSAVWVVTPNGRFTIAAYAAPKTGGLWREVAGELADSLRKDGATVSIQDGRWGREVVGIASGVVRFIGIDGYRWMIRCVVNGSPESIDAVTDEAREALVDTVVRRGDTPLPVRTPLPVQLPEPMTVQLREAAARQGMVSAGGQSAAPGDPIPGGGEGRSAPSARRSAAGSAMQQLRSTTGG